MTGARLFTLDQIETALRAQGGVKAAAARALEATTGGCIKCSRELVAMAVHRSKRLQQVCDDVREFTLDLAESAVLQAIQAHDLNAAKFLLETRGKARGFTKRVEMTGKNGAAVEVALPIPVAAARRCNEQLIDEVARRMARQTIPQKRRAVTAQPDQGPAGLGKADHITSSWRSASGCDMGTGKPGAASAPRDHGLSDGRAAALAIPSEAGGHGVASSRSAAASRGFI
jgi:hypothetical protein